MQYKNIEPPIDPPEAEYIIADCGCEVYEGEELYTYCGRTFCPDCIKDEIISDLETWPVEELIMLVSAESERVEKRKAASV